MIKNENINKSVTEGLANAIKDFVETNNINDSEFQVTVIDPMSKVIIRLVKPDVMKLRAAEKTIYHGNHYDVFEFKCITAGSGILEYDECLTDEYRYKCSM